MIFDGPDSLGNQGALAHLAAIVGSSDDAIISKSMDGTILSWNRAAERIFGYSAQEIVGQSILLLIPPERQEEEKQIVGRLLGGERIDHFNTVRLTREGARLDVMVSISPVRDGAGEIIGASKVLRTMTPQRQAEQARLDSEARLRAVVEGAVDGIITFSESGLIESINPAGQRMFGYSRGDLLGQSVAVLIPQAMKLLDAGNREGRGLRKGGAAFALELAVSRVQLADRMLYSAMVRDITQRKQAEQLLTEAKDRAEEASRAKEHFLSVLSHELRTPLTPVLAEISFIEQETDLSEDLRNRLGMVRRNIETEARLVDDLLDLTRITRGKIELRLETIDLHEVLRNAVAMMQRGMDAKGLELSVALRAREHHVRADGGRILQIFLNLLSNAVKFAKENGLVKVATANPQADVIEVEVSDDGAGIEPAMMERLFNAFEQDTRSRPLGGLGLGLSIARSLAELQGGTLTARSGGKDCGATFKLVLSTAMAERTASAPAVTVGAAGEAAVGAGVGAALNAAGALLKTVGRRILLVEDHDDTRIVMTRLLKSLGCEVKAVGCVKEALQAAEQAAMRAEPFDLLISDIGLPDGSGLDVMRHMKDRVRRGVALSGFGQEEDLRRSREAGFATHLIKPISFKMLREVVQGIE
jgi:PAS domain S-box-containing protein